MKLRFKILVMGSALAALMIAITTLGAMLAQAAGDPAAGKAVFASSGCGGCHALADAGASGKSASNFDTARPGFDAIVSAVTNPPPGMPKGSLSD